MTKLRVLDLFSGIGGFSLGLERTGGFETVAFCEIEPFPRKVLAKHWPKVPCYHDIRTLKKTILELDRITVDAICAGFPCQDLSVAGRGAGIEGSRSGLWREVVRLIGELRPLVVVLENVTGLLNGGLHAVLGALASLGYDAEWHCIRAARFGLPHRRDRIWIIAHASGQGRERFEPHGSIFSSASASLPKYGHATAGDWLEMVAGKLGVRTGDGLSVTMERRRLHGIGNSVVPAIPELIGNAILQSMALSLQHLRG